MFESKLRRPFLAPAVTVLVLLFAAPLAIVCMYSLSQRGAYGGVVARFTLENFVRIADPLYLAIFARTFLLSGIATILCLVLGFPLALFIARSGKRKTLYLQLVMLPFWTSFLVRTYAWMFILRDTGLLNTAMQRAGLTREPLPLLYNEGAVLLGLVYGYLPFMVLPVYAALERLDPSLLEASADLGARPYTTLWRVIVPLSAPGIHAGALLVFIPCLGAFLTPDLMGGGKSVMAGNLIQNQFTTARDWPFGSAVALAMMLAVLLLMRAALRKSEGGIS